MLQKIFLKLEIKVKYMKNEVVLIKILIEINHLNS